ncbi:hypothetical protein NA57DRAFT_31443 [Rhizodiscina lignyota]|uniref:Protein NO VEIN C-terminal domain-containing protein n=1 Tax=Rhizodiscina lignyota TaxID=1504668 RepID=A0A9P4IRZ4_9PEZI|nr:hypothetical protein NA57DRAFT_31443 [Rhizodiscina lignyota]
MDDSSVEDAREFIDKLRYENGGLTKEDREYLENRPTLRQSYDNLRRKLGVSTRTLAEQLYAKDTRFVYELIQNAEDNNYTTVNGLSDLPWLRFGLYQDRIEIDSNEDGFSRANIRAICSTGESTKTNVRGYIGEKGIGFKSVFKVAYKVHIQSGVYSFAFEHQRDGNDNGLGMVTPVNEPHRIIPDVRTRMILYLLKSCDQDSLRKDLLDLPETLLLFLRKLKRLSILIALQEDAPQERHYSLTSSGNRATIHKAIRPSISDSSRDYLITRRWASNMPLDGARKGITDAEIVLAFPLDAHNAPIVEEQHVFAFLPLRKVGYKFLIQSDFIAQASREDVFDNKWNRHLLEEISKTFMNSVDAFLEHPTLRHCWVRYIPTDRIADEFWGLLQTQIFSRVSSCSVFSSRDNSLWKAKDLYVVPRQYRDAAMQPLIPDYVGGPTAYISEDYDTILDVPILRKLGTTTLSTGGFLGRINKDLDRLHPRLHTMPPQLATDWHTRVADQLIAAIQLNSRNRDFLRKLPIVPLNNGRWVRTFNASVFFPTSGGTEIPPDLPLNLVNDDALQNESRKKLFSQLGIAECAPARIFPLIEQTYPLSDQNFDKSLSHVKFMFWHHKELPSQGLRVSLAPNDNSDWFRPSDVAHGWVYCPLPGDGYAASSLIPASLPEELRGEMHFVKSDYYNMLRQCPIRNGQEGVDWFREFFQIKHNVQLYWRKYSTSTSYELDYIRKWRPESLLGVLEASWFQYNECKDWDDSFAAAEVPILKSHQRKRLDSTYLPLPKLVSIVRGLDLEDDFGFIQELQSITEISSIKWSFLKRFGVSIEESVTFWLALLTQAKAKKDIECRIIFEIYRNLQKFSASHDGDKIRRAFEQDVICLPPESQSDSAAWIALDSCVWMGPDWFTFKTRLGALKEYGTLYGIFVNTLRTSDANLNDFLAYLQSIQESKTYLTSKDEERKITLLYKELQVPKFDIQCMSHSNVFRSRFEDRKLIYDSRNLTWHAPSSCIWAEDRIQLPRKVSLASAYKGYQSFFTKTLGVTKPNLQMHINALEQKAANEPEKQDILQEMLNICAFNPTPDALKRLGNCECFPIKPQLGNLAWVNGSSDFAIIDRREYGELFSGKLKILDLTLEEVHSIKDFLDAMQLEERYLSSAVKPKTSAEGGSLSRTLTDDLRKKSYAICRFAAHFGSARVRRDPATVQSMLQSMEVYSSSGISMSLSIKQADREVTIDQKRAYFHLKEEEGKLTLYVPKNGAQRQVCYASELPAAILKHFGAQTAESARFGHVIAAPGLSAVNELLEINGIIEVAGIETPNDDSGYESDSTEGVDTPPGNSATPLESTSLHEIAQSSSHQAASPSSREAFPPTVVEEPEVAPAPSSFAPSRSPTPQPRVDQYRELLDVLIRQAQGLSSLPHAGQTIRAAAAVEDRGLNTVFAVESSTPGEREFRIGAAGELFVFEVLKSLALPNFSLNHWQSTIRGRVSVHDDYQGIRNWIGTETADIVYHDYRSALTERLISLGYLGSAWRARTPTYYIEVKSTLGLLEMPFFCSQPQVSRMDGMRLSASNPLSNDVYLIFRVFTLGDRTGFKIYFDPGTLKHEGELEFRADKFAVTSRLRFHHDGL